MAATGGAPQEVGAAAGTAVAETAIAKGIGTVIDKRLRWLCLLLTLAGCGPSTPSSIRIAVVPKGTSHQFWKSIHAGALQAARERGNVEIIWKGPQVENETKGQIDVVRNFITSRVDGICLAPNHSQALIDVTIEAMENDIPVVVLDSGLGEGAQYVSYVATDNFRGGQLGAQRLAETLDEQGNVILLRYMAGSESTEQREEGFLAAIREYPGIQVLSSDQYGDATTQSAMQKSSQLLLKYRDQLDGVFAVNESNSNGMLTALENAQLAGRVKFVAFDPSDALIRGLGTGKVHGIVLQDPVQMGYQAVNTLLDHLEGKAVQQVISTGEYVATAENMNETEFQRLLNPQQAD
jgi:ribose transport system substrate-binding protein